MNKSLEIMEAIINEVSDDLKAKTYVKRAENVANSFVKAKKGEGSVEDYVDATKKFNKLSALLGKNKIKDEEKAVKAEKDAINTMMAAHKKVANEALDIMEEIINEVSVKKWKEAAKNSIEGRNQKANDASDNFGEVVYPFRGEVNDPGHKRGDKWGDAEHRLHRAKELAKNLPDSNKSANKVVKAAKNSVEGRNKANDEASKNLNKAANDYKSKKEHTEADRKELVKVQNKWVDTQKKEDTAHHILNKPVRRHERQADGSYKLKADKFAGLNANEAFDLMEEIINEVSVGLLKRAAESSHPARRAESEKLRENPEGKSRAERKAIRNRSRDAGRIKATLAQYSNDNKTQANKLINAAKKVANDRKEVSRNFGDVSHPDSWNKLTRAVRASQISKIGKTSTNEALDLMEEILNLSNFLFEVEGVETEEVPPSTNKIKRTKKDKKSGEETEVVSVADELFPYEGNAKEQFNQKVLAKINDMIEGTGTLEDLMQFVRRGAKSQKAHESLEVENDSVTEALVVMNEIMEELSTLAEEDLRSALDADFHNAAAYLLGYRKRRAVRGGDRVENKVVNKTTNVNRAGGSNGSGGSNSLDVQIRKYKKDGGEITKRDYMTHLKKQSDRYKRATAAFDKIKNDNNFNPAKKALIQHTVKNAKAQMDNAAKKITEEEE